MVAIATRDLTFAYGRGSKRAVDGVTFEVAPGEIFGFLGPNGAGKSTTIKMLTGQLEPRSGEIEVRRVAAGDGLRPRRHQRAGRQAGSRGLWRRRC